MNKLIIFGSNGMLGNYMTKYFQCIFHVIPLTRNDFDITFDNLQNLETIFVKYNINSESCIINCCGMIPQRNETNTEKYYLVNTLFPQMLAKLCRKYGSKLILPTTDCVFDGSKGNYIETDIHTETNVYGNSKSLGEVSDFTVIRTSIIGEESQNQKSFLEWVRKNGDKNMTINGYTNHLWNGITCLQYCKIFEKIIKDNLFWNGIKHLYSPQSKNKYELACIIKNVYNLQMTIIPTCTDKTIDKTLQSIYNTNDIFDIPTLETQIYEQITFSKK